jgi:hypothetical protein
VHVSQTEKQKVEREFRLYSGQTIQLAILGENSWSCNAQIIDIGPLRTRIAAPRAVNSGLAVRIDAEDALLLGEVRGSSQSADHHIVEIDLMQIIPSLSNLAKIVSAVMEAGGRAESRAEAHRAKTPSQRA